MRAGIEIFHPDTGIASITDRLANIMVAHKGTITTGSVPSNSGARVFPSGVSTYAQLTKSSFCPMLALRCTTGFVAAYPVLASGTPSLGEALDFSWDIYAQGTGTHSIDYWVFDLARNGLVYDEGPRLFEVYAPDGEIRFSAVMRCFERGFVSMAVNVEGSGTDHFSPVSTQSTHTGTSGRIYAHIPLRTWMGYSITGNRYLWNELVGFSHADHILTADRVRAEGEDLGPGIINKGVYAAVNDFLFVDVTNL